MSIHQMALVHCGHTFCSSCLDTLLRSPEGSRCPICRSEIAEPPPHAPLIPQAQQTPAAPEHHDPGSNYDLSGPSCAHDFSHVSPFVHRASEIRFRMNRMHMLYPEVMTIELLRSMNNAMDRNSLPDFRHHVTMRTMETRQSIASMREATSSGARSNGRMGASRRTFGGGSSRGGGGGGGRW